jgi:hypothetical protein
VRPVLGRGPGVAGGQRLDQRPLDRRGAADPLLRLAHGVPGVARALLVHRGVVDVDAVAVGDAPPGHRRGGVQLGGAVVGTDRLIVVEAEGQLQTLIEVALGLGRTRW